MTKRRLKKIKLKNRTTKVIPKKKRKLKIRFKRVFLLILIMFLLITLINIIFKFPIKNIYIKNNTYLTDQEIIDIVGIGEYPSIFSKLTYSMENDLEKNIYIAKATIKKSKFREIEINVVENRPLFYYITDEKTIFENKETLDINVGVPSLINYVPDSIYNDFFDSMKDIDTQILNKISEIKYDPNDVDNERFLLTMIDGNYIYINIKNYSKLNSYINIYADIIETYGYKLGILYLDSGEYFTIIE